MVSHTPEEHPTAKLYFQSLRNLNYQLLHLSLGIIQLNLWCQARTQLYFSSCKKNQSRLMTEFLSNNHLEQREQPSPTCDTPSLGQSLFRYQPVQLSYVSIDQLNCLHSLTSPLQPCHLHPTRDTPKNILHIFYTQTLESVSQGAHLEISIQIRKYLFVFWFLALTVFVSLKTGLHSSQTLFSPGLRLQAWDILPGTKHLL